MTQSTEQERAEFTDGAWYWVEKEGWTSKEVIVAPACYCAAFDSWHSYTFSGVATRYVKVLEPCVRHEQAARRAPVVPQGWRELAQRCLAAMEAAVQFRKAGQGRPPEQTCLFEIEELRAMLAAAPQPVDVPEKPSTGAACTSVGTLCTSDESKSVPEAGHASQHTCS